MNKTTEALNLSEEALYAELESDTCEEFAEAAEKCHKALAAIREVLAQPVKQEPVAWDLAEKVRRDLDRKSCPDAYMRIAMESIVKHYAAPVSEKRKWVELTDYEIVMLYAESPMCDSEMIDFARAVIATFKEKNK